MATDPSAGFRALVVDDHVDICNVLGFILDVNGITSTCVTSVQEALEVYQLVKPDILIADITMPLEDGYSLIRKVRALSKEEGGQVPAIALTGHSLEEFRHSALEAGFQDLLTKPVDVDELLSVAEALLKSTSMHVTG